MEDHLQLRLIYSATYAEDGGGRSLLFMFIMSIIVYVNKGLRIREEIGLNY